MRQIATPTELHILCALQRHGNATASELALKDDIKRGTIYVVLQRLHTRELVKSRVDKRAKNPGLPRPIYSLTEAGKRVVKTLEFIESATTG